MDTEAGALDAFERPLREPTGLYRSDSNLVQGGRTGIGRDSALGPRRPGSGADATQGHVVAQQPFEHGPLVFRL